MKHTVVQNFLVRFNFNWLFKIILRTRNSSGVNPVNDEFPSSIYPSIFSRRLDDWNDGIVPIKLQRKPARVITGETYDVGPTEILENLGWMPIEEVLRKRETIMAFKALTAEGHRIILQSYLLHVKMILITYEIPNCLCSNPRQILLKEVSRTELQTHGTNYHVK